ncbi:hypothetical protein [Pseudoalteromonas ulvae]|uniref:Uncharacterized protein n=1 Tax=Pseudoalteromonas ulvae TaxID=107327 RepID=A0A2C9ZZE1_PSEDV|nr:hypothetical protein [Pseudoalteromonas ulvae]OUL56134.1 hypothetical protein B1199_18630 [Pseudoalteromonas ulvae]
MSYVYLVTLAVVIALLARCFQKKAAQVTTLLLLPFVSIYCFSLIIERINPTQSNDAPMIMVGVIVTSLITSAMATVLLIAARFLKKEFV